MNRDDNGQRARVGAGLSRDGRSPKQDWIRLKFTLNSQEADVAQLLNKGGNIALCLTHDVKSC